MRRTGIQRYGYVDGEVVVDKTYSVEQRKAVATFSTSGSVGRRSQQVANGVEACR